ncbi:hypothetical protein ACIBH1_05700 [Nonomuraea sp. NPDC050663]|uniref:hypothetical protein n=1 Tax=Nonomuraea sp. NPDC050663 TaxID=3364370 RepID=UPI0037A54777
MRRAPLGTALRLAGGGRGAVATLGVLLFAAALLVSGAPKAVEGAYDAAMADTLRRASALHTDLTVTMSAYGGGRAPSTVGDFAHEDASLRERLPGSLRGLVTAGHHRLELPTRPIEAGTGVRRSFLGLVWASGLQHRVRWVAGRPPGAGGQAVQVGLPRSAAEELRVGVGTTLRIGATSALPVEVTGLYEPLSPADRFWDHHRRARAVEYVYPPGPDAQMERHVMGLVADAGLPGLAGRAVELTYSWVLPLDPGRPDARAAPGIPGGVTEFGGQIGYHSELPGTISMLRTDLPRIIEAYLADLRSASAVVHVVLGALLLVAAGVLALAVLLLCSRMERPLSLMRARGCSLAGIALTGAAVIVLGALPATVAAQAVLWFVPGPAVPLHTAAPAALALATAAGGAALLAVRHRVPLPEHRGDLAGHRSGPVRVAIEVALVGLGVTALLLLRARGLNGDPLLLLAPLLITLAGAVPALRAYPLPLLLLVRLASRRRDAVPYLGLVMAARARLLSAAPVLVLVPALAVSVFGAGVSASLADGQERRAWSEVGADARAESAAGFPAGAVEKVRRVPGVTGVVPIQVKRTQLAAYQEHTVLALDLAAFRELVGDTPVRAPAPPPAGPAAPGEIAALVPPELMGQELEMYWGGKITLTASAPLEGFPGRGGRVVVIPADPRFGDPALLYVRGADVDRERLAAALGPGVTLTLRSQVLSTMRAAPLTGLVQTTFLLATLLFAGYAALAVVLALVITSKERGGALTLLRTLGLTAGQARRLTLVQVAPVVLLGALTGVAAGLALPLLLDPLLILRINE